MRPFEFTSPILEDTEETKDLMREKIVAKVRKYFDEKLSKSSEERELAGDKNSVGAEEIKELQGILGSIEVNDYTPAYHFLEEEIEQEEQLIQGLEKEIEGHNAKRTLSEEQIAQGVVSHAGARLKKFLAFHQNKLVGLKKLKEDLIISE